MADSLLATTEKTSSPIELVRTGEFDAWKAERSTQDLNWLQKNRFTAKSGQIVWLPDDEGNPYSVAVGWNGDDDLATLGGLPYGLPAGVYHLTSSVTELQVLGWALGAYRFDRYKSNDEEPAQLLLSDDHNAERLTIGTR